MLFDVFFATEESDLWEEKRGYLYAIAELRSGLKKKKLIFASAVESHRRK